MSESLRSLIKNERMSESLIFFEQMAHSLIFGLKTSDSLGKPMSKFPALKKFQNVFSAKFKNEYYHGNSSRARGGKVAADLLYIYTQCLMGQFVTKVIYFLY